MASRLALITLSAFASLLSVSAESLSLKVSGPAHVDDVSGLQVKATLTNTGESAVKLVNDPRSVLSTKQTHTFSIVHESGAGPDFTGMRLKYSLDSAAMNGAVTTLNPGQSIDVTHSLAGAYNFTVSGAGVYEIAPSTLFHAVFEGGGLQPVHATLENSHTVTLSGAGRLAVSREPRQRKRDALMKKGTVMKRASFQSCSASEESQINQAIPAAVSYVSSALSYLQSHTTSTTRFTTWFGSFTSAHHTTILNHFNSVSTSSSYTGWNYDCACEEGDDNTYAYTFANEFGDVFLCPRFFVAPVTGTDSKGGTLVHESTHFQRTAGTQDFEYGQTDCRSLAKSNPSEAIANADSHEYFAENSPAQS